MGNSFELFGSKKVQSDHFVPKKGILFPISGSIVFQFEHWQIVSLLKCLRKWKSLLVGCSDILEPCVYFSSDLK